MYPQGTRSVFGRKAPIFQAREEPSTLLIVEDQELLAQYMGTLAEDLGWIAEIAGSVRAVEDLLEESHPAVLVLDLGLPDGDGVELLRHLSRRRYQGSILIVSSCGEDILESCGRLADELGLRVAGRARKPITAARFAELLDRSLPESKH
ncbi:MAG: response regulator [Sphingomicrobium sp.]